MNLALTPHTELTVPGSPPGVSSAFTHHADLTVAGGPVRLYQTGTGDSPILLLHGGMLDTAEGVWRNIAPRLASNHRVYAVDLPRHGASRPWPGCLDRSFFETFMDELLDRVNLPRVAIIGLSLGAGVGIGYALKHPGRVSGLIACGPGGVGAKRTAQFTTWLIMRTPKLLRVASRLMARSPGYLRKSMINNLTAGEQTRDFETIMALATAEAQAKTAHRETALDDWQVTAYGPFAMRTNYIPDLDRLTVPSLWMRGANDPLVGHPELAAAAAATAGGELVTVPDAGHIVTYDQPDEFNRLTETFLEKLTSTEGRQN